MTNDPIRKELDELKADLARLREDISGLTDAVKGVAAERVNEAKGKATDTAKDAWEEVARRLDALAGQGREAVDQVGQQVGQHPAGSLMAAFGMGFVIAKLLDLGGRH